MRLSSRVSAPFADFSVSEAPGPGQLALKGPEAMNEVLVRNSGASGHQKAWVYSTLSTFVHAFSLF